MEDKIIRKVQVEKNIYSESFKRSVCEEHLRTGVPKDHLQKKYGIKGKSSILYWMRKYGYFQEENEQTILITMTEDNQTGETKSLEAKVKELEKALEQAKLEKEAWRKMVEVAERDLKINIQKKSGTKRSKK